MSELTEIYLKEFHDADTRHIYADNFLNTYIATQIKVLREDRDWTQSKLAEQAGMKQERISVLENVNYESWSVKTLKRLAKAFDLRLAIKFESFGSYLTDYDSFNRENLKRSSFDQDPVFHPELATATVILRAAPGTGKTYQLLRALNTATFGTTARSFHFKGDPAQAKFEFMQQPQPKLPIIGTTTASTLEIEHYRPKARLTFVTQNIAESKPKAA